MINKKLLKQILLFEKGNPVFSIIRELNEMIVNYQNDNNVYFFSAKRGQKSSVVDEKLFFEFVSSELLKGKLVENYDDIKKITRANTREENIKLTGDSKTNYVRVFDNVVVFKKVGEIAQLLQQENLDGLDAIDGFVAVENGESFLNIDKIASQFKYKNFIYLAGNSNTLTRDFLKNKKVEFFLDFDIEGLNIFENFVTKEKTFFVPRNIEELFLKYPNTELYKKQVKNLKPNYSGELEVVQKLIIKHNTVVEQEVLNEAY